VASVAKDAKIRAAQLDFIPAGRAVATAAAPAATVSAVA